MKYSFLSSPCAIALVIAVSLIIFPTSTWSQVSSDWSGADVIEQIEGGNNKEGEAIAQADVQKSAETTQKIKKVLATLDASHLALMKEKAKNKASFFFKTQYSRALFNASIPQRFFLNLTNPANKYMTIKIKLTYLSDHATPLTKIKEVQSANKGDLVVKVPHFFSFTEVEEIVERSPQNGRIVSKKNKTITYKLDEKKTEFIISFDHPDCENIIERTFYTDNIMNINIGQRRLVPKRNVPNRRIPGVQGIEARLRGSSLIEAQNGVNLEGNRLMEFVRSHSQPRSSPHDMNEKKSSEHHQVTIYPNPSADWLRVDGISGSAQLFSEGGRQVMSQMTYSSPQTVIFDVSTLSNGKYILVTEQGNRVVVVRH